MEAVAGAKLQCATSHRPIDLTVGRYHRTVSGEHKPRSFPIKHLHQREPVMRACTRALTTDWLDTSGYLPAGRSAHGRSCKCRPAFGLPAGDVNGAGKLGDSAALCGR